MRHSFVAELDCQYVEVTVAPTSELNLWNRDWYG